MWTLSAVEVDGCLVIKEDKKVIILNVNANDNNNNNKSIATWKWEPARFLIPLVLSLLLFLRRVHCAHFIPRPPNLP